MNGKLVEAFSKMQKGHSFLDAAASTPVESKIQIGLSIEKAKELFENQFGIDQRTRTRKQWKALVKQYGYGNVMIKEKMTRAQIKAKCKNA